VAHKLIHGPVKLHKQERAGAPCDCAHVFRWAIRLLLIPNAYLLMQSQPHYE